jgi:hypothetical protein
MRNEFISRNRQLWSSHVSVLSENELIQQVCKSVFKLLDLRDSKKGGVASYPEGASIISLQIIYLYINYKYMAYSYQRNHTDQLLEDDIRMNLKEIGVNTNNWVDSVQDRDLLKNPYECGIEIWVL